MHNSLGQLLATLPEAQSLTTPPSIKLLEESGRAPPNTIVVAKTVRKEYRERLAIGTIVMDKKAVAEPFQKKKCCASDCERTASSGMGCRVWISLTFMFPGFGSVGKYYTSD